MTATTATIKNTLKGTGIVELKDKIQKQNYDENASSNDIIVNSEATENQETQQIPKTFQINLTIEDKDLEKLKVGQLAEIIIKNENTSLNYLGEVSRINKDITNKSTLDIEITNPDEHIQEKMSATCAVILKKAENVVALPIEAIQKNEQGQSFVDVVQPDGTTKETIIKTGLSDDYYAEITSGLSVGTRVQIVKSSTTVVTENKPSKK